ncbi:uncharacterized protein LOC136751350 isoform X3 [Amia ocellicauda]|uniref:uncharacterized protein LOC136751350 isoform X3 n=1 Tax=Amia ocellicauda TaxID=2972642 RepID=UPI003464821F
MGNCNSRKRHRRYKTGEGTDSDDQNNEGKSNKEDVLYATIDHGNKGCSATIMDSSDDVEYATVIIPSELKFSSKEDCNDDYVLMN